MKLQDQKAYVVGSSLTQVRVAGVTFSPQSPKSEAEAVESAARMVAAWNSYLFVSMEAIDKGYVAATDEPFEKLVAAAKTNDPAKLSKAAKAFEVALQKVWGKGQPPNFQFPASPVDVYLVEGKEGARLPAFPASNLHRLHIEPSKGNSFDVGGKVGTRWRPLGGAKGASFEESRAIALRMAWVWNASEGLPTNELARGLLPRLFNAEKQTAMAFSRLGGKKGTATEREAIRAELVAMKAAASEYLGKIDRREDRLNDCAYCLAKEGIDLEPAAFTLVSDAKKAKATKAEKAAPIESAFIGGSWLDVGKLVEVVKGPYKGRRGAVKDYSKAEQLVVVELFDPETHRLVKPVFATTMLRPAFSDKVDETAAVREAGERKRDPKLERGVPVTEAVLRKRPHLLLPEWAHVGVAVTLRYSELTEIDPKTRKYVQVAPLGAPAKIVGFVESGLPTVPDVVIELKGGRRVPVPPGKIWPVGVKTPREIAAEAEAARGPAREVERREKKPEVPWVAEGKWVKTKTGLVGQVVMAGAPGKVLVALVDPKTSEPYEHYEKISDIKPTEKPVAAKKAEPAKPAPAPKPAPKPAKAEPAKKPVPKVEPVAAKKPTPKVEPVAAKKPVPKVEPVKPQRKEKPVAWAGEIKWFI